MKLRIFLIANRLSIKLLAQGIGMKAGSVGSKIRGERPWKQVEIDAVIKFCRSYQPSISYDDLFGDL
jgi:hypothetical protein